LDFRESPGSGIGEPKPLSSFYTDKMQKRLGLTKQIIRIFLLQCKTIRIYQASNHKAGNKIYYEKRGHFRTLRYRKMKNKKTSSNLLNCESNAAKPAALKPQLH
jgi:hypothetical protein